MNGKECYVFDTNTIISVLLFEQSNSGLALNRTLESGILLLSMDVAEEYANVLRREKFDHYVRRRIREEFLRTLIKEATFVEITETIQACRDSKDDKFLELAVSGGTPCLITGDEDLLILNPFREISILSPRQFLELFTKR